MPLSHKESNWAIGVRTKDSRVRVWHTFRFLLLAVLYARKELLRGKTVTIKEIPNA